MKGRRFTVASCARKAKEGKTDQLATYAANALDVMPGMERSSLPQTDFRFEQPNVVLDALDAVAGGAVVQGYQAGCQCL